MNDDNKLKLCRYSEECKSFKDDSYTCWHEDEAVTYCGIFRKRHKGGSK